MTETPPSRANPVLAFLGWAILLAGVLLAGLAGLCTLALVPGVMSSGGASGRLGGLMLVLTVGGIPIAIGGGLIFAGVVILKAARGSPRSPPKDTLG